ncbi:hypothetical protein LRS06_18990 [Hymenobacter sp. J193]|uniref:hypothetical protein n=1 Tax=Hymenobacter sp. J193 TaxID=2898429 RepID=UPI002151ACE4|nr:hypothetical protein [Hymenobacter sp. J193]MCR5889817.1 hypothetical protein [Hymenobacter sp. J193]
MPIRVTLQEQPAEPENQIQQVLLKVGGLVLLPIWLPLLLLFLLGLMLVFGFLHLWDKLRGTAPKPFLQPELPSEPVAVWQNERLTVLMQEADDNDAFYKQHEALLDTWTDAVADQYFSTHQLFTQPPITGLNQVAVSDFVHPWADGVLLQLLEAAPGSEAGVTSWLIYVDGRTLTWQKLREIGLYALHEANPPLPDQVKGFRINGDELTVRLAQV